MGNGNFGGGGSVTWEVVNSDGESGGGNKNKCNGKDKDPKVADGWFVVLVNGEPRLVEPTESTTIQVVWGPETLTLSSPSAVAPGSAKKKARKSKTAK